jgi:threonine/homoserine/homoserine lactone efflux protein
MVFAVLAFVGAASLVILLPGPDTLVVLRSLLRQGPGVARRTALGVLTGLSIWAAGAVLGLSALLRASRTGYDALRIVGAVYLCLMGIQALRARGATSELDVAPRRRRVIGTGFVGGLMTDLLNPKVGVFFVTFLPAFVPSGEPVGAMTLLFGAIFVVETGLYFLVFLRFAERIIGWMRRPALRKALDGGTGAVLIGFGVKLGLES